MKKINRTLLFNASNVALVVTALTFATRGGFIAPWMEEFSLSATQVGWIVGTAFWGFTLAMVVLINSPANSALLNNWPANNILSTKVVLPWST